jgi:hypothetical protein
VLREFTDVSEDFAAHIFSRDGGSGGDFTLKIEAE